MEQQLRRRRPPIVGMSCVSVGELAWTDGPWLREATVDAVCQEQSRLGNVVRVDEASWVKTVRVLALLLSLAQVAVLEGFWAEARNTEMMPVPFIEQAVGKRHGLVERPNVEA